MKRDPVAVRALAIAEAASRGAGPARRSASSSPTRARPSPYYTAAFGPPRARRRVVARAPRAALASRRTPAARDGAGGARPARASSPLVPAMVAERLLTDSAANVQVAALDALTALHPADSVEPMRLAYERGGAGLKVEVLVRATHAESPRAPRPRPGGVARLDDADANVRRHAFTGLVLSREAAGRARAARRRPQTDGHRVVRHLANLGRAQPAPRGPPTPNSRPRRPPSPRSHRPATRSPNDLARSTPRWPAPDADTALPRRRALALLGTARARRAAPALARGRRDPPARRCRRRPPLARRPAGPQAPRVDARRRRRGIVRAAALDATTRASAGRSPWRSPEASLRASHGTSARAARPARQTQAGGGDRSRCSPTRSGRVGEGCAEAFRALGLARQRPGARPRPRPRGPLPRTCASAAVHELTVLGAQGWRFDPCLRAPPSPTATPPSRSPPTLGGGEVSPAESGRCVHCRRGWRAGV